MRPFSSSAWKGRRIGVPGSVWGGRTQQGHGRPGPPRVRVPPPPPAVLSNVVYGRRGPGRPFPERSPARRCLVVLVSSPVATRPSSSSAWVRTTTDKGGRPPAREQAPARPGPTTGTRQQASTANKPAAHCHWALPHCIAQRVWGPARPVPRQVCVRRASPPGPHPRAGRGGAVRGGVPKTSFAKRVRKGRRRQARTETTTDPTTGSGTPTHPATTHTHTLITHTHTH